MHREFKDLLPQATGTSEFAIVVNLDIRGFSAFSAAVESPSVAMYIKRVYMTILDQYFANAAYFKPTGDGLLIIMPFTEQHLQEIAEAIVGKSLALIREFPGLCREDPMVNFETPQDVGIGISRGTVSRLESSGKILDYSGRYLNLASRLMELARPSGVVLAGDFGGLLSDTMLANFASDEVFLRGIAERAPIEILYSKDTVVISERSKLPLQEIKWKSVRHTGTFMNMKKQGRLIKTYFKVKPSEPSSIRAFLHYRKPKGAKWTFPLKKVAYHDADGNPGALVDMSEVVAKLRADRVKGSSSVTLEVRYPVT